MILLKSFLMYFLMDSKVLRIKNVKNIKKHLTIVIP